MVLPVKRATAMASAVMQRRMVSSKPRLAATASLASEQKKTEVVAPRPPSFASKIRKSRSIDMPMLFEEGRSDRAIDGNTAAAHVAYSMSDVSFIYPISPSTSMGETMDKYAAGGRKNVFGQTVQVRQMQSELGSAGALHGALSGGTCCTTFTCSQGLLLMIPNMYLLAGELLPAVFHVSARALARQALSIFCDHSDVMSARTTGVALLSAHNQQETMDMAVVAHLAALKASVPFVHFFDGTRTSSAIECVQPIPYSVIKSLMPWDKLDEFRKRGLNPQHPIMRGLGQDPQTYYQASVSANRVYDEVPHHVQQTMDQLAVVTGRQYKLFDYYGCPEAERVIVIMGSAAKTCEETVDYLRERGEKVGVLKVRLFRPFSVEHFLEQMPQTAKAVAVLDRTKEDFASSLPLHADVLTAFSEAGEFKKVVGGHYGLGSKEFSPRHVKAVFDNLSEKVPKNHYCVGINDDVTQTNLPIGPAINTVPANVTQALFFGLGSDGTVGANKAAASIIGERTEFYSQGHFNYSSQKAGASTISHLRFGPQPIRSQYEIEDTPGADYVACMHLSFLPKFDLLGKARQGGVFVVNCPWSTAEELENEFPAKLRRAIAEKEVQLYTIDAHAVAQSVGLPAKRINQVMQGTFFNLSKILPKEEAKIQLEAAIDRMYGSKSPKVVASNKAALAAASENLNRIKYPQSWLEAEDNEHSIKKLVPHASPYSQELDEFAKTFLKGIDSRSADSLPTSAFSPGGEQPIGQAQFQKRALAEEVPVWIADSCTQCNLCSVVCPHAVVRPFLLDKKELETTPKNYQSRKAKGGELGGLNYTIQLAPYDCTGCAICVEMCPDDALEMQPQKFSQENFNDHWEFSLNRVSVKDSLMEKNSVKGSQFQEPLMEFSGACSGCGETPYVKLLTQMFGDRMVIANSSGCSSVWGGSYGMSPFKTNRHGQGPAWARSLFEDTAEYGLGMALGSSQRFQKQIMDVKELLTFAEEEEGRVSPALVTSLQKWLDVTDSPDKCSAMLPGLTKMLEAEAVPGAPEEILAVKRGADMLVPPSHWIIGGDGWAYDIGFGGLDHVLASGQNINVLVLDTEGYSNTGFQISKATPQGAAMKMASGGNKAKKKDLGAIAMMHENCYVASVSLAADVNQTVKAFKEAEAYNGPSVIVAYATCVDWGHKAGDKAMVQQQVEAVGSGYWPLYRYHPENIGREAEGIMPLEMDNKRISQDIMDTYVSKENRFTSLQRSKPEHAKALQGAMFENSQYRHEHRKRLALNDEDLLEYLKKAMGEQITGDRVTVLYGSDTGNAEIVAKNFQADMKGRGMRAKAMALNDIEISDLQDETKVLVIASTAGQGEMPKSALHFWSQMESFLETAPADYLKDTKFAVFGMGDSSYVFFNEAAKKIDDAFAKLGASRLQDVGMGDDQHPARFDTELEEWSPDFYDNIEAPPPPQELPMASHLVQVVQAAVETVPEYIPHGSKPVTLQKKISTVPEGYERPIDHFEFDLSGSGLSYDQGDSLGVWASNPTEKVNDYLKCLGLTGDEVLSIKAIDSNRSVPLPELITSRTLLTQVMDMNGWPKRRFYEMLKLSATDPAEKAELEHLCTKEGKSDYMAYTNESYTYGELLEKFPSAKVDLATLLDYVPDIKPRLYSIASSSRLRGDDECHLCIIKNDWKATSGRTCVGLSTGFLQERLEIPAEGVQLRGCVHPSAVAMPDTHATPLVMVALGTGIAPMRAFIEERAAAKRAGEECGDMALFFGARNRQEYSYEKEFTEYQEEGVLTNISLALSREQKEKIYVTHRIEQEKQLIFDLIHEKEGRFYLCGPGGNVPPQVRNGVIAAIRDCGGKSQEYAEKYVEQMQINGRYNVEAW